MESGIPIVTTPGHFLISSNYAIITKIVEVTNNDYIKFCKWELSLTSFELLGSTTVIHWHDRQIRTQLTSVILTTVSSQLILIFSYILMIWELSSDDKDIMGRRQTCCILRFLSSVHVSLHLSHQLHFAWAAEEILLPLMLDLSLFLICLPKPCCLFLCATLIWALHRSLVANLSEQCLHLIFLRDFICDLAAYQQNNITYTIGDWNRKWKNQNIGCGLVSCSPRMTFSLIDCF